MQNPNQTDEAVNGDKFPLEEASSESRVHKPWLLGLLNFLASCLGLVMFVLVSQPATRTFFYFVGTIAAVVLLVVWLVLPFDVVTGERPWGTWKLTIVPLVFAVVILLGVFYVPTRVRFAPSQSSYDKAVAAYEPESDCAWDDFDKRLGLYEPKSVFRDGDITFFSHGEGLFGSERGIAHSERDLRSSSSSVCFDRVSFRKIADNWYVFREAIDLAIAGDL